MVNLKSKIALSILVFSCVMVYSESECSYNYLKKAYYANSLEERLAYCDSAIQVDSSYLEAYLYKFHIIYYPRNLGYPKPDAKKRKELDVIRYGLKNVVDKAWQLDSNYFPVYENKLCIYGWEAIDKVLFNILKTNKCEKDLYYNSLNLQCSPDAIGLFYKRAELYSNIGKYDSALVYLNKYAEINNEYLHSLKLKKEIFSKMKNKSGVKAISNIEKSEDWLFKYKWISMVEGELRCTPLDCCKRFYCSILLNTSTQKDFGFRDLKLKCKKILNVYDYLKPFELEDCQEQYGDCKNLYINDFE